MNRIHTLFRNKPRNILSIYFAAGYPQPDQTKNIIRELDSADVDMIEIGMPFSDPMADGTTIQEANQKALQNGISISQLFDQLKDIRELTNKPLIMMGYLNPIFKYGVEKFCYNAQKCGIDGLIIPDLPFREYQTNYKTIFEACHLSMCFLITPETSEERIRQIDSLSNGFIYLVTNSGVTGKQLQFDSRKVATLERIANLGLKTPVLAGFGISNRAGFNTVCKYTNGAIIGSGFIRALGDNPQDIPLNIHQFIKSIVK